jgi:hypothetical protein
MVIKGLDILISYVYMIPHAVRMILVICYISTLQVSINISILTPQLGKYIWEYNHARRL